jgi:hypothetical protein
LKKRTKKLLSMGAGVPAGASTPAPQCELGAQYRRRAAPGKVFWFFFSKKNFLPSFDVPGDRLT